MSETIKQVKIPIFRFDTPETVEEEVKRLAKLGKQQKAYVLREEPYDNDGLKQIVIAIPEENAIEVCWADKKGNILKIAKF